MVAVLFGLGRLWPVLTLYVNGVVHAWQAAGDCVSRDAT